MKITINLESDDVHSALKMLDYIVAEVEESNGRHFHLLAVLPHGGGSFTLDVSETDSHFVERMARIMNNASAIPGVADTDTIVYENSYNESEKVKGIDWRPGE